MKKAKKDVAATSTAAAPVGKQKPLKSVVVSAKDSDDLGDLQSIFGSIKAARAATKAEAGASASTTGSALAHSTAPVTAAPATDPSAASADSLVHDPARNWELRESRPRARDGLYRAPERTLGMSDEEFFSGSGGGGGPLSGRKRRVRTVSVDEAQVLKREGVDRIVSEKELQGMLSRSKRAGLAVEMSTILDGIRCTPSRRPLKFAPGPLSYHSLVFDPSLSREERMLLFMELFAFYPLLVDPVILPDYTVATYTPEELLEIRVVTDPRHPAFGQAGLYARRAIAANTVLTPYAGVVEIFGTSCNSRTYTMGFGSISDDYALDAEFCGNYGRFANDPRGVEGLGANISAESRFNARGESFTALVARRQISEGEEILMSYGKAHSLAASPWVTVRGEQVTRRREGGLVPMPLFGGQPELLGEHRRGVGAAASAVPIAHGKGTVASKDEEGPPTQAAAAVAAAPLAYHLLWECPQCGAWTRCQSSVMMAREVCRGCATPKLSGARMVALLSSPALTDEDEATGVEVGAATALSPTLRERVAGSGVDADMAALDAAWRSRAPVDPLRLVLSIGTAGTPQVGSSTRPPTERRPTPGCSAASPRAAVVASPSLPCEPAPASPRSPATLTGGSPTSPGSASASYSTGQAPLPPSSYTAVRTDWPVHVPFIPWQYWDPAVPLSAVTRHTRFDAHEHVLLYTVDMTSVGAGGGASDVSSTASAPSEPSASSEGDGEEGEGRGDGRGRRGRRPRVARAADTDPLQPSAPREDRRRRPRRRRSGLWERQSADGLSTVLYRSLTEGTGSGALRLGSGLEAEAAAARATAGPADSTCGATVPAASGAVGLRFAPCAPLPALTAALHPYREGERWVLLHTRRPTTVMALDGATAPVLGTGGGGGGGESVLSPLAATRAALCRMVRRPFAGKSFRPGDTVAYFGGVIRRLTDPRMRPEHSPLVIPMHYLCPAALRALATAGDAGLVGACGGVGAAEDQARRGVRDLLHRLRAYCLVVTNDLMYCPVLAPAAYEDCGLAPAPDAQWVEEAQALVRACNVALALTLDSLGCPHVVGIATRHIASFEPLLARVQ